jgi:hypothetical protein
MMPGEIALIIVQGNLGCPDGVSGSAGFEQPAYKSGFARLAGIATYHQHVGKRFHCIDISIIF